jgi:crotonobetainyl-CoA:carnitine CoA-transferase CaiB-like acyl-CoA transferase
MSGMMDLTGSPDSGPYRSGVAVFDVITGLHTAIGVLAALNHLHATGEGQRVKANLMSSALSGLVNQSGAYVIGSVVPHRMGNAHPSIYPYEPIETADGQLVVAIGNNRQFELLCSTIGAPELPTNPCFATNRQRSAHRDELRPLLVAALASRSAPEWYDLLSVVGVPCAPILDVAGGISMAERLGLDPVVHCGDSGVPAVRHPLEYSATAVTYDFAPPTLNSSADRVRGWLAATRNALSEAAQ